MRTLLRGLSLAALGLFLVHGAFAQEGKISGQVVEEETGEPLPGANVVLVGTQKGTTTNPNGQYTILNVDPGTYTIRASAVGFENQTVEGVEVSIDLTTELNFQLPEETVGLEGVTIQAEDRVVQQDLSASRVDIDAENLENLPVTDVQSVVGLQAGVQGLNIRGSERQEADFRVDGASLSSSRDRNPYSAISYTSVKEVQVQSGGFSAEYGNLRSGLVNVVTKDPSADQYTAEVLARYRPPTDKHFGPDPDDPNSYWMRPFMEGNPENLTGPAFEGTEVWPEDVQQQYPDFRGFNALASEREDLTPRQAQELFKFRHRKDVSIDQPDWVFDGTIGGPVPVVSESLGDLRFLASYRQRDRQYVVPISEDGYSEYNGRLKLTSDLTSTMELTFQGMRARQEGQNDEFPRTGPTRILRHDDRGEVRGFNGLHSYGPAEDQIFGTSALSESYINRSMASMELSHTISENTFYDAKVQWYRTEYRTGPPLPRRDTTTVATFGDFEATEAPLGYSFSSINSLTGMRMGGHHGEFRDTTNTTDWLASIDVTSQVNQSNEVKAGLEVRVSPQEVDYEYKDFLFTPSDVRASWDETPIYGAAYVQDKLEFEGLIVNAGLRLDYFDPNSQSFTFGRFPEEFLGRFAPAMDTLLQKQDVEPDFNLSPRLGVSFPITESNKIYFNYGHFYQQHAPDNLYEVQRSQITNGVSEIANPTAPRPKTVSYELGYEQSLFDQYLVRVAGYYKDEQNQPRTIQFQNRNGLISYTTNTAENYEDIRGVEISLFKNQGDWFRGFVNYTYDVENSGNFGLSQFFQNRVQQREFERNTTDRQQTKPLPQPFGRISLTFLTPSDFGPEFGGVQVLGDWRINLLGRWQAGENFTFTNQLVTDEVADNLQWDAYKMVDLRLSKQLTSGNISATIFADVNNVFNLKNMNKNAFYGPEDFRQYINSLHLSREAVEGWEQNYQPRDENGDPIYGDDQPGDLGADYINPPNGTSFTHLFPREVYLGIKFSF